MAHACSYWNTQVHVKGHMAHACSYAAVGFCVGDGWTLVSDTWLMHAVT